LDLLVARDYESELQYVENVGTQSQAAWADRGTILTLDGQDHPRIAAGDIDGDGDYDFVSAATNSAPQCWENIGTAEAFEFVENPSMLAGVDAPPTINVGLELLDIDDDGDPDLLVSSYPAGNLLYLNERTTAVKPTSWSRIKALYR
jgi:hypothetical protein